MGESTWLLPLYTKPVTQAMRHTQPYVTFGADFNGENRRSLSCSKAKLFAKYSPSKNQVFSSFSSRNCIFEKPRLSRGCVLEPLFQFQMTEQSEFYTFHWKNLMPVNNISVKSFWKTRRFSRYFLLLALTESDENHFRYVI